MFTSTALTLALALLSATAGEPHVASCDRGPVMIGSGSPSWRRESLDAGPLGVRQRPLREMSSWGRPGSGQMTTKMPVLVEGHETVTIRVPPRLQRRVFLYYGFHEGPDGKGSTSFSGYPGDSAVEFQPCADKPRTIWPGGIRIRGRAPVRLEVLVEGSDKALILPLGRPTPYEPEP
jgi:hypothetical protein